MGAAPSAEQEAREAPATPDGGAVALSSPLLEFSLGEEVLIRSRGGTQWYEGTILSTDSSGNYEVMYSDSKEIVRIPLQYLRKKPEPPCCCCFWCCAASAAAPPAEEPSEPDGPSGPAAGDGQPRLHDDVIDAPPVGIMPQERVQVMSRGGSRWFNAVVTGVNEEDDTYDLEYEDGQEAKSVQESFIRRLEGVPLQT